MVFCFNEQTACRYDTVDVIKECGRQGVRHIELRKEKLMAVLRRERSLASVRNALKDHSVKPVCLDALHRITFNDSRGFTNVTDLAEMYSSICCDLGCPYLMVAATMIVDKSLSEVAEETAACLRRLSETVRAYGIGLTLEFHGNRNASVKGFMQALNIIRESGCDNVALCLDTWNLYRSGSCPEDILNAGAHEISGVHLCDSTKGEPFGADRHDSSRWPGEGAIDLADILQKLKSIGFNGPLATEIYGGAAEGIPLAECIRKAKETTEALMRRADIS